MTTDEMIQTYESLIHKLENRSKRYIEAEEFIIKLNNLKWYQRFGYTWCKLFVDFYQSRKKYNF